MSDFKFDDLDFKSSSFFIKSVEDMDENLERNRRSNVVKPEGYQKAWCEEYLKRFQTSENEAR